ncbi:MAG: glycoside hydrolase family 99-like domain-containing protein [Lentimicrobiaceae bacterium]|nr:glycoside hydrolase family 99-like domain-containing protein [Lentimicrobiaceae bacterium]
METTKRPIRVIAFYLPQYHPIPENDQWWGKGFTEWTNVGNAKPLFRGHYQPRVPADLGYYDLRLPQTRIEQAEMAKKYGVEGFCYWHYWFGNGRQLLERPFKEVLESGQPDYPFCLSWANHSWDDKQFSKDGTRRILIEQLYPGEKDDIEHFNTVLPAFKDSRHITVDGKPIFMIYNPFELPNAQKFITLWQQLAVKNGLKGIHFIAHTYNVKDIGSLRELGFDSVNIVRLFDFFKQDFSIIEKFHMKLMRIIFKKGRLVEYSRAAKFFTGNEDRNPDYYPTIIPNWDHSPRSGRNGHILIHSTPKKFENHVLRTFENVIHKDSDRRIVFLKSWNEWAEGNYMEPDLKFGLSYLEALDNALREFSDSEKSMH